MQSLTNSSLSPSQGNLAELGQGGPPDSGGDGPLRVGAADLEEIAAALDVEIGRYGPGWPGPGPSCELSSTAVEAPVDDVELLRARPELVPSPETVAGTAGS